MTFVSNCSRSYGTVNHSTKNFGFIEVQNNAAIPSVFFDRQALYEQVDGNLAVEYPKGTFVSFIIIPTNGEHKVKYRAESIMKEDTASSSSASVSLPRQKVSGHVNHSTNGYGFIGVKDNSLSISKVYFDYKSFLPHESGDLSLKYPRGTLVNFNIIPTDGEHKVKHRAANILKDDHSCGASNSPKSSATGKSGLGKACKRFLKQRLMKNGAKLIEDLIEELNDDDDCPAVLRNATTDKIIKFANENETVFVVKNNALCLVEMEKSVAEVFEMAMEKYCGRMMISQVNGVLSAKGDIRIYLYASDSWQDGVKDYIARNPTDLIYWDDTIWTKESLMANQDLYKTIQNNLKAVKYFSQFVLGKGTVAVESLAGHNAQASPAITSFVSARKSDFLDFLNQNSFFFDVSDDEVECSTHRITVLDGYWLKEKQCKQKRPKKTPAKVIQSISKSPIVSPTKAFCETGFVSSPKTGIPCSDQNDAYAQYTFTCKPEDSTTSRRLSDDFLRLPTSIESIFLTPEEKAFSQLLGKEISSSIEKEILSRNLSSLNDLILIRLLAGKQPRVKIFDSSFSTVINCTLANSGTIDGSIIQNILSKKHLLKQVSSVRYGVKNTLHSLRVSEENGKIAGITVFCQTHGDSRDVDVIQRKNFTAVVSDISKHPAKYVYDFLRIRCCELSQDSDVLLLDVDGQLSGLDDTPHPSVGRDVHRVSCSSSSELPAKINDAIQHSHDYVILINADDSNILQMVLKMCRRGINVIAEVPAELRNEIERIFSS